MSKSIDITGQLFGRLTAIRMTVEGTSKPPRQKEKWLCSCECGNETEVAKRHLVNGNTRSCGCLVAETTRQQKTIHGHRAGGKSSSEYASWASMLQRCSNPKATGYENWGGRGIIVCPRWAESFETFLADMGPKPSPEHEIDRFDNDKGYSLENCRWATRIEQANNKRNNRLFTINGRRQTIAEWAREGSIAPEKLRNRIDAGWSPEIIGALLRICRERASLEEGLRVS
jgi:hypothetical protein